MIRKCHQSQGSPDDPFLLSSTWIEQLLGKMKYKTDQQTMIIFH